jgi:hypothetical protein
MEHNMPATTSNTPMMHDRIERPMWRTWEKSFLIEVVAMCRLSGYDCIETSESMHVGFRTTKVLLRALKISDSWRVCYEQKLFDENYADELGVIKKKKQV